MREAAIVEIYGRLKRNIAIKRLENNEEYGITTVSVTERIGDNPLSPTSYKTNCFTVLISKQEFLKSQLKNLYKGQRVLIIGHLDILKLSSKPRLYGGATMKRNSIVINITDKGGIKVLDDLSGSQVNRSYQTSRQLQGLLPKSLVNKYSTLTI